MTKFLYSISVFIALIINGYAKIVETERLSPDLPSLSNVGSIPDKLGSFTLLNLDLNHSLKNKDTRQEEINHFSGQIEEITSDFVFSVMDVNAKSVNAKPFFELSTNTVTIFEDKGKIKIDKFVSSFDDGDPKDHQKLTFITEVKSTTENLIFKTTPDIDEKNGDLKFEIIPDSYGQATISVILKDNGGTKKGGIDTSDEALFTIIVTNINDPPTINAVPSPFEFPEDGGEQVVKLTGISAGTYEDQQLEFIIQSDNQILISDFRVEHQTGSTSALLHFSPNLNQFGKAQLTVTVDDGQSENNQTSTGFLVVVHPVADTPTVTPAATTPGVQTVSGLVISRNIADGDEVTHFKITDIQNGSLFQHDGVSPVKNNDFISYQQGNAGLKYTPFEGISGNGSFGIQATTGPTDNELGGEKIKAQILINNAPVITSTPDSIAEVAKPYSYKVIAVDPSPAAKLIYTFSIPELVSSWLNTTDNRDGTALLNGIPSSGSEGIFEIYIKVEDQFGTFDEQVYNLKVNKQNVKPELSLFTKSMQEDDTIRFTKDEFNQNFYDADGDTLHMLKIVNVPQYGTLFLNGNKLRFDDTFEFSRNDAFIYVPNKDYHGLDTFNWNASDGKDFAIAPQQLSISITSVNDPPTINSIPSPFELEEDGGEQVVELFGISAGTYEDKQLEFSIQSDNPTLISDFRVEHQPGNTTALLYFSPHLNQYGEVQLTVIVDDGQSENNQASAGLRVIVHPVADTPTVTPAATIPGVQTISGLIISRNIADGNEVTHFKITNILNGYLFQHDGISPVKNNEFITYQQGNAGLKFTPFEGIKGNGSFGILAATGAADSEIGGEKVIAQILVENDSPVITSTPDSIAEVAKSYSYKVVAIDPDPMAKLTYSFSMPDLVSSWLSATDNQDGTALMYGIPPSGSEGLFEIYIKVEDQFGSFDEQVYKLKVNKQNKKPQLSLFTKNIQEDDTIRFTKDEFNQNFYDADGDTLHLLKIVNVPQYGTLFLNGVELDVDDSLEFGGANAFIYVPDKDYHGLDIFDWNASDGKDFALIPQRLSILISSVNDPPEILYFEENPFIFEYGQDRLSLTDSARVVDPDGDKLERATITISANYMQNEDSLYYEKIEGLSFDWQAATGTLLINGIAYPSVFQQALRSVAYVNLHRLSPGGLYREIEIRLQDIDTISVPYVRRIEFMDTFVELDIPNGFTPNDDGVNDTWNIDNLSRYEDFKLTVFSRRGIKIFESNDSLVEWDGYYNGELVPVDTYYYQISINEFEKVFRGTVTVLR